MQAALHLFDSTAIMAALALMYGVVRRLAWPNAVQQIFLGVGFGLGAVATMLQPIMVNGNVIIDCRALFTGFAAAFLGVEGAAAAFVVAALGRLAINISPAALFGVLGLGVATLAGRVWYQIESRITTPWRSHAALGMMISASLLTLLLVPELRGSSLHWQSVGLLSVYNVLGSLVLGSFIHRERMQADREAAALRAAATDPLTGVLNRRGFSRAFALAEAATRSRGSAMLMIDIDHFKAINDTHGHAAGDLILRLTSQRIRGAVGADDIVLRAGGEEFGVLLTDTDGDGARVAAESIRDAVGAPCHLSGTHAITITASVGGFCWATGTQPEEHAARVADKALYAAKAQGRNRTVFEMCACQFKGT